MAKREMTRKAPSDSTLQRYWRLAVYQEWGRRCAMDSGTVMSPCEGDLECHHIVKRSRTHLKHLPENGIPLCKFHHNYADTGAGRAEIRKMIGESRCALLDGLERKLFKDYLVSMGITRAEFLCESLDALKKRLAND